MILFMHSQLSARTGPAQVRLVWLVSHRFDLPQRAADPQQPISDDYARASLPYGLHVQVILCVEGRMQSSSRQMCQRERKAPIRGGFTAVLRAARPSGKLLPVLLAYVWRQRTWSEPQAVAATEHAA